MRHELYHIVWPQFRVQIPITNSPKTYECACSETQPMDSQRMVNGLSRMQLLSLSVKSETNAETNTP
jgi:hypothetical protein